MIFGDIFVYKLFWFNEDDEDSKEEDEDDEHLHHISGFFSFLIKIYLKNKIMYFFNKIIRKMMYMCFYER